VRSVHGIGPARRVEIGLGLNGDATVIEVDAPRKDLGVGQPIGLAPEHYRLFSAMV
jgi:hypothetical protein